MKNEIYEWMKYMNELIRLGINKITPYINII